MKTARVTLFTGQIDPMSRYYGEVLGLKRVTDEKGWKEFAAGGARIALHPVRPPRAQKGPKIVFYAKDVAGLAGNTGCAWRKFWQSAGGGVLPLRRLRPGRQSDSTIQPLKFKS
jgi:catechol 2,3-dioxygenase-like lactoylglutathione lyase family enzyme